MTDQPKRGPGRPPIHDEPMTAVHVRLPADIIAALDETGSRSGTIRRIVEGWARRHRPSAATNA